MAAARVGRHVDNVPADGGAEAFQFRCVHGWSYLPYCNTCLLGYSDYAAKSILLEKAPGSADIVSDLLFMDEIHQEKGRVSMTAFPLLSSRGVIEEPPAPAVIMNARPGVNDHPDDDRAIVFFFQYMESFFPFFKHKHSSLSNPGQWRVTSPVAQLTK